MKKTLSVLISVFLLSCTQVKIKSNQRLLFGKILDGIELKNNELFLKENYLKIDKRLDSLIKGNDSIFKYFIFTCDDVNKLSYLEKFSQDSTCVEFTLNYLGKVNILSNPKM